MRLLCSLQKMRYENCYWWKMQNLQAIILVCNEFRIEFD